MANITSVSIDTYQIEPKRMGLRTKKIIILYPGMPVDVFIITCERSLLNYIFAPIFESSYKAFREE
ncbi:MAG: hypothetical protein HOM96_00145 [Rickettsiales bacterium]|nr:hypothetical protein [Rickettsiales bacterium]